MKKKLALLCLTVVNFNVSEAMQNNSSILDDISNINESYTITQNDNLLPYSNLEDLKTRAETYKEEQDNQNNIDEWYGPFSTNDMVIDYITMPKEYKNKEFSKSNREEIIKEANEYVESLKINIDNITNKKERMKQMTKREMWQKKIVLSIRNILRQEYREKFLEAKSTELQNLLELKPRKFVRNFDFTKTFESTEDLVSDIFIKEINNFIEQFDDILAFESDEFKKKELKENLYNDGKFNEERVKKILEFIKN